MSCIDKTSAMAYNIVRRKYKAHVLAVQSLFTGSTEALYWQCKAQILHPFSVLIYK